MKNIQIIDGALNATFSIFQATEEEFAAIFPDGQDMELAEDLFERLGDEEAGRVLERFAFRLTCSLRFRCSYCIRLG